MWEKLQDKIDDNQYRFLSGSGLQYLALFTTGDGQFATSKGARQGEILSPYCS